MINQYKIIKLDKRHKGYRVFSHQVDFMSPTWRPNSVVAGLQRHEDFNEVRGWCWEVYGPSEELDYMSVRALRPWAWWRDQHHLSIYFTETAVSAYILKFAQ